jgi:hypothetical protein
MTHMQDLPAPSFPQAHCVVQALLLVALVAAPAALLVPANFGAVAGSAGKPQPPLSMYLPALQTACLNPYEPGAQPFKQESNPGTHAVAVAPTFTEFGPVHRTSV